MHFNDDATTIVNIHGLSKNQSKTKEKSESTIMCKRLYQDSKFQEFVYE